MVVSHRYDFQRPSIKTYRGRHRNHVRQHSISQRGVVGVRPSRAREENRAGDVQRPARRGSRRDGRRAERYERTAAREACRSGHYKRKLVTTGGEVVLDVPKLRGATLLRLRRRGVSSARLVTGDKSLGMLGALEEVSPETRCQRCTARFYRNVFGKVPRQKRTRVAKMLKAIHAQESREASEAKASEVADSLESMKLFAAAKVVREGCAETLAYTDFPMRHWTRIRTNNVIERLNREIRRRTRVVGTFPYGKSTLMPVTARLKYIVENEWGRRRYLDVSLLEEREGRI